MKEKTVWEPKWWNFKLFWTEENTKIKESKHKFRLNKINSDLFTVSWIILIVYYTSRTDTHNFQCYLIKEYFNNIKVGWELWVKLFL